MEDTLICGSTTAELLANTRKFVETRRQAGITFNLQKSPIGPTRSSVWRISAPLNWIQDRFIANQGFVRVSYKMSAHFLP
jgi:hypothetical protein